MTRKLWSERVLTINGPVGLIEIKLGEHQHKGLGFVSEGIQCGFIMCHPHPLFSGTMDNKVVTTLIRAVSRLEVVQKNKTTVTVDTLRFNFRGVGSSEGQHDNGKGEQDDLAAVVDFAVTELGWQAVYLAGFSFGSGIACLYANKYPENIAGLFMVAPAVHHFAAPSTLPFEFESHVYMGDADEVVPFDEVEHWVDLLTPQPHWHIFEDAGHFFHGRLIDLKKSFLEDIERCLLA